VKYNYYLLSYYNKNVEIYARHTSHISKMKMRNISHLYLQN